MIRIPTTEHPAWCHEHPEDLPNLHRSAEWRGYGLVVVIDGDDTTTTIEVDTDELETVAGSLTPDQAHELGFALIRAADRVRRADLAARVEKLEQRPLPSYGGGVLPR
jgi:hypothetical protein